MTRRIGLLIVGTLLVWVLTLHPAQKLWGGDAPVHATAGMLICLVPAAVTLFLGRQALGRSPDLQLLAMLGGVGVRMAAALGVGFLLYWQVPAFHTPAFWGWLLLFYLVTLALEMVLLLSGADAAQPKLDKPLTEKV